MLEAIHPKLPKRNKALTKEYYIGKLGFVQTGTDAYPDYLMLKKDKVEIHFFLFEKINPAENYGQVYISVKDIEIIYNDFLQNNVTIHPNAPLQTKP